MQPSAVQACCTVAGLPLLQMLPQSAEQHAGMHSASLCAPHSMYGCSNDDMIKVSISDVKEFHQRFSKGYEAAELNTDLC